MSNLSYISIVTLKFKIRFPSIFNGIFSKNFFFYNEMTSPNKLKLNGLLRSLRTFAKPTLNRLSRFHNVEIFKKGNFFNVIWFFILQILFENQLNIVEGWLNLCIKSNALLIPNQIYSLEW